MPGVFVLRRKQFACHPAALDLSEVITVASLISGGIITTGIWLVNKNKPQE